MPSGGVKIGVGLALEDNSSSVNGYWGSTRCALEEDKRIYPTLVLETGSVRVVLMRLVRKRTWSKTGRRICK